MIRIGILGAARIAPRGIVTPANALLGAEVVAIAARSLDRAQDFAAQHSIPMAFGSYAELLARDDIDLVYVALPPSAHLEWCTAALASGKHVLVEKPFASNARTPNAMVAAARAANRQLIEGFHYRFHPLFARTLDCDSAAARSARSAASKRSSMPTCRTRRANCATSKRSAAAPSWIWGVTACTGSARWPATNRPS